MSTVRWLLAIGLLAFLPDAAFAAGGGASESLSLLWVVPFAGLLLSVALFPLVAPHFWHQHFGKISAAFALLFLVPYVVSFGASKAYDDVAHVYVLEFIPFLILLWALYTVAGGIRLKGRLRGTPMVNTGILLLGTVLASWMGTTGAAMLLIRPLLRANAWRKNKTHLVVFFIFLVANIGGALTPLGDPPLFLGFLKGVSFFWTTHAMLVPMLVCVGILSVAFFLLDSFLLKREEVQEAPPEEGEEKLGLEGAHNLIFLVGVVGAILYSGAMAKDPLYWDQSAIHAAKGEIEAAQAAVATAQDAVDTAPPEERQAFVEELLVARGELNAVRGHAEHEAVKGLHVAPHVTWPYINLVRDGVLVLMGMLSLWTTARRTRRKNDFTWFPIVEVGKLFAGIFVTIIPAIAILKEGPSGALSSVVMAVTAENGDPVNSMYFWLTGGLSSFLDNAPTYLVFFNTAGGNAEYLMGPGETTLLAISAGAVFMGAMTYVGNAPNFMVRSIAEEAGVKMPSFFGYLFRWSLPFLGPIFLLLTYLWFMESGSGIAAPAG